MKIGLGLFFKDKLFFNKNELYDILVKHFCLVFREKLKVGSKVNSVRHENGVT